MNKNVRLHVSQAYGRSRWVEEDRGLLLAVFGKRLLFVILLVLFVLIVILLLVLLLVMLTVVSTVVVPVVVLSAILVLGGILVVLEVGATVEVVVHLLG